MYSIHHTFAIQIGQYNEKLISKNLPAIYINCRKFYDNIDK